MKLPGNAYTLPAKEIQAVVQKAHRCSSGIVFLLVILCLHSVLAHAAPASSSSSRTTLLAAFDEVLQRVVALRHLQPQGAIRRDVRNRQQIRASILALSAEAFSPTEWEDERKAMVQWGLLPPEFPLRSFVLDLLTEQAAGYYDPKERTLFIADWLPDEIQKPVLAHELVHAVQDQHYDLRKNFDMVQGHADLTLARKALIEGDAMVVMFTYLLQPMGLTMEQLPDMRSLVQTGASLFGEQFQIYAQAPLILRQQLLFPYVSGTAFIKAALAQGGWARMARVYQQPPVSTEQILHPEKYFAALPEVPQEVHLQLSPTVLQGTWTKLKRDILGEFLLSVVLQQFLPEAEAIKSAAGWAGDRYELFEQQGSGRLGMVAVSAWDTLDDATEFVQSYKTLLARKYPGWSFQGPVDQTGYMGAQDGFAVVLRQRQQLVHIAEGVPLEDVPRLLLALEQVSITSTPQR